LVLFIVIAVISVVLGFLVAGIRFVPLLNKLSNKLYQKVKKNMIWNGFIRAVYIMYYQVLVNITV
jgi:hypothetical protein